MQNLILPLTLIVTIDTIGDLTNVCFQNAVFLLSVCFILITDSSCKEPAHAVAKAWGCTTPTAPWIRGHACVLC